MNRLNFFFSFEMLMHGENKISKLCTKVCLKIFAHCTLLKDSYHFAVSIYVGLT